MSDNIIEKTVALGGGYYYTDSAQISLSAHNAIMSLIQNGNINSIKRNVGFGAMHTDDGITLFGYYLLHSDDEYGCFDYDIKYLPEARRVFHAGFDNVSSIGLCDFINLLSEVCDEH